MNSLVGAGTGAETALPVPNAARKRRRRSLIVEYFEPGYFRDLQIAAPLKPLPRRLEPRKTHHFRDLQIAAPLKLGIRPKLRPVLGISAISRSRPH